MSCIRKAEPEDLPEVVRLAAELWPQHTLEELEEELEPYTDRRDAAVFLAYQEGRKPCGFAQCGLRRDYVEGTENLAGGIPGGDLCPSAVPGTGNRPPSGGNLPAVGYSGGLQGICPATVS